MSLITPTWQPPCDCERCQVARVTDRRRPYADCHGRDLLRWWLEYEKAREAFKRLPKRDALRGASYIPQCKPNGEPL